MVAHPKQKRTVARGLRPSSSQQLTLPPSLRRETLEKMRRLFSEILDTRKPSEALTKQELFVINHLKTVVQYHLELNEAEKSKLNQKIWKNEEEGHRVGFNQEQIGCLNFLVLEERKKGQLNNLLQKLEEKIVRVK